MEAARFEPQDGGRTAGALEDGGGRSSGACASPDDGSERSRPPGDAEGRAGHGGSAGAGLHEGSRDHGPRACNDEGPRSPAPGSNEGPSSPGPGNTEGPQSPGVSSTGATGPRGPISSSNKGPQSPERRGRVVGPRSPVTSSTKGPQISDVLIAEGPHGPGRHDGPQISDVLIAEGPHGPGRHDGPQSPERSGGAVGPRSPVTSSFKGPQSPERSARSPGPRSPVSSSTKGPRISDTLIAEGSHGSGRHDGPQSPERSAGSPGPRSPISSSTKGPRGPYGPGRHDGSESPPPRSRSDHAGVCSSEGPQSPDTSGAKRPGADEVTGSRGPTERRIAARTGIEEPDASGAKAPADAWPDSTQQEPHADDGPHEDAGNAESFKKPAAPVRPDGHEKTLEPRQSAAPQPPGRPGHEAAPTVSARLPSDAYKSRPAIPYGEPDWSGRPQALYSLEILKGGSILATKSLTDANWIVFGRLPACHVPLEHPSVSRFHAVLQYRSVPGSEPDQETGFYVYDLGSTHGTFLNKQRIQAKTYCRFRVGHVLKFGGSTRLFILQGPEEDQEAESELTVTQIKEARRQRESLQKRMMGEDSDEDDIPEEEGRKGCSKPDEDSGCMWGMGDDAMEEEESEENPIALQFQEEREALYIKDPKKTLQGFFDREGEELEFEYDEKGPGSWICRVKLPVDDPSGKQLIAEVNHSGKKKDAARLCSLEACRMLDMRGLLRQEAVSRKRKAKKWEDEDFYDSDDDTFLDRTGVVEKKRLTRMKKAGKIEEKPETFESLTSKLELVEKELEEIATKLKTSHTGDSQPSAQDSLDAFMKEMRAGASLDSVSRKKLHLQTLELRKEQQRLKALIKIVQPTKLPELQANSSVEDPKAKKRTLPMFGAMKGGSKYKLKTGTVGKLPPKRTDLPASLFTMKDEGNEVEEEEEEEEDDMKVEVQSEDRATSEATEQTAKSDGEPKDPIVKGAGSEEQGQSASPEKECARSEPRVKVPSPEVRKPSASQTDTKIPKPAPEKQKKMFGPSRPPPGPLSTKYPEDDPDYCVWTPPAGQTGDGKTHLNEKYGY